MEVLSAVNKRCGRACWRTAQKVNHQKVSAPHIEPGLPRWLSGKEPACQAGDMGLIPGSGKSPGEGNGNPLKYSCLGNLMHKWAWGLFDQSRNLSETRSGWDPECFKLQWLRRFLFGSPCRLRHCVTQSTEVLGRVTPMSWSFHQVEGLFIPLEFSLEAFDAFYPGGPW